MSTNSSLKTRYLCLAAVFAAIIFLFTAYIHIPSYMGYIHVGDAFIYLAASMLPLPYAAAAGAIGAGLADVLSGYAIFAPGTIIIKGLTALCFSAAAQKVITRRNLIGIVPSLIICVGGYLAYETILTGQFGAALSGAPGNVVQVVASGVLYYALGTMMDKMQFKSRVKLAG